MLHILLLTITCLYFPQTYAANAAGYDPSLENVLQESLAHFPRSEPSRIFHPEQSNTDQSPTSDSQDFIRKVQSNSMSETSGSSSSIQASATRKTPRVRKVHFVDPTKPKNTSQNFPKGLLSSTNPTPTMPFTSPVAPTPYGTDSSTPSRLSSTPSRLSSTPKEPIDFQKLCEDIAAHDPLFEHWAHLQVISRNKNPLRTDNIYETMFNLYGRYSFSDYIKDIDKLYNETIADIDFLINILNTPTTYKRISSKDAAIARKGLINLPQSGLSEEDQINYLLFLLNDFKTKYPIANIIYNTQLKGISRSNLEYVINGILACEDEDDIDITIQYLRNDIRTQKAKIIAAHSKFKQSLPVYFSTSTKRSKKDSKQRKALPESKRIQFPDISERERYERIQQRAKQQNLLKELSL
ncbi:hypothetical protein KBD08_00910 [Candidatus Babeliales bacterium]|nr:hypothetical protein [Candidatus Babeliales bacterium]